MSTLRSKDFYTGLLFTTIGAIALFMARNFEFGTPMQMGAGFFPVILSSLILVLGAIVIIKALLRPDPAAEPIEGLAMRPTILISASVVAFALTVRPLGLIPAIIITTVVSRFAVRGGSVLEYLTLTAVLVVTCVLVFVYGLGMPYRLGFGL